ncbi:MAG: acetyl-CoA acetyltransferase [Thermoleophilia bacterium]|nr:acetyl-CoA acetyltransferase [Thermoleophilia bacterium]
MTPRTVILGYARTPFGKLSGGLASLTAAQLGGHAIAAAIERSGIKPEDVQHVVMGHVLQAGAGQITARQAAFAAGLAETVTAETVNKVCASAMRAISLADLQIRAGEHDVVVAGGMESMTNAPHVAHVRAGVRMGDASLVDSMLHDGLTNPFRNVRMLTDGAEVAKELGISRDVQDAWAARSHQRVVASEEFLAGEIAPVTIHGRKGDTVVDRDESVRPDTTVETLARLKELDVEGGGTTAGNAPSVNDGGTALVLASEEWALANGHTPLAYVGRHAYVAGRTQDLALMPGNATKLLLEREGLTVADIARFEFNEAFASVTLHAVDDLGIDPERVNVHGGAIALGHPIGASGARIVGTLMRELQQSGGGLGIAGICSGGGQGDALLIEVPAS